ncbi:Vps16, C-terminal region-domain-containing protein [Dunaliella salina]|uniref:Vps16, C-terminal region-domain-containing protein n=1 Tax=Dunaliella salina TaxID=3046 RepID=A0ABQ7FXT0_DUNSA|nr:Vps16, C-terminal region-domain-containing protein [Dunaliella salina]|eukprot:KAF5827151.1 Vps16, C-terminal region-domain-containing protein [Dunaliella salina]
MQVLLGAGGSIWQLDEVSCVEHPLAELQSSVASCTVHIMRLSPNGAFVAIFTVDGRLIVVPSDFSRQLSEFETQADSLPLEVEWCGSDGVVVLWPGLLLVVGPYGDHASWTLSEEDKVLLRWACAMISAFAAGTTNARTDVELKEALMTKLKPCSTFRYAPLAAHAQEKNVTLPQSREHTFKSRAMSNLASLKREQARIEADTGHHLLVGLSLADTMMQLIRLNHHKHAAGLKRTFAMSDRRFWWLKIRALAEGHDWDGLDAFAAEKKSPIGWEPFLEVARKHGAPRDVQARLISRQPDNSTKAEQLAALECTREAAEVSGSCAACDQCAACQCAAWSGSAASVPFSHFLTRIHYTV